MECTCSPEQDCLGLDKHRAELSYEQRYLTMSDIRKFSTSERVSVLISMYSMFDSSLSLAYQIRMGYEGFS